MRPSPRVRLSVLCATVAAAVLVAPLATGSQAVDSSPAPVGNASVEAAPLAGASVERGARLPGFPARWSADVAERGDRVVVRGRLPLRHRRAVLQLRTPKGWVVRDRDRASLRRYRLVAPTGRYGRFTYRVVAPVTRRQRQAGLRRAVSASTTLRVVRAAGTTLEGRQRPSALGDPSDFTYITTTPARWNPCDTITYRVNARYGPASAMSDVAGAVARIEEASGLDFEYVGRTDLIPRENSGEGYPADTQIVIAWASRTQSPMISGEQVAGVGGPIGWGGNVDENGDSILTWTQGTVVLNNAFNALPAGFGTGATIGKLLMHEIGHVVGLGHAATESQVMYATLQREYPTVWGAGDRSGLVSLGAEQGCIVTRDGSMPSHQRAAGVSVVSRSTADVASNY